MPQVERIFSFAWKKQHLQHLKYINNTGKVIHAYEFCLGKPK